MNEHVTTAQLKADMATVLRDAEALIHASSAAGGEKMNEARAKIRESLEAAKTRLHEAERAARQHGEEALHATEDYARRIPGRRWASPRGWVSSWACCLHVADRA